MSECSCQISVDLDDAVELLSAKNVTAKTAHKCGECRREIPPGEKYLKESYVSDGHFRTEKTCADCRSIRDYLFCDFYYGMILETLETEILEYDMPVPEACIAKLTPAARERVCELIELTWEDD
jgi:hypothetical protein